MQHIIHIDMDAFFASVEIHDNPKWAGKPLVVGSPPDKRGVVSTASYEARKFGIHSAMPSRIAYKLCPEAIFVPVRMRRYLDVSDKIMTIIHSYTPNVEQVSVDEAFMDVQGVLRNWESPCALASDLQDAINKLTGLTASVGVATNKYLAKLASDYQKPNGITVVPEDPDEIRAFLAPLPVSRIWGVGKVTEKKLHEGGFRTIEDIQQVDSSFLSSILGPALAAHIVNLAIGEDTRRVVTEHETKSISSENTFTEDVHDKEVVRRELVNLVEQVGRRLRKNHTAAKTVVLKLRYEDFQTVTRQETYPESVCSDSKLLGAAIRLLENEVISQPVRLIGFGVTGLGEEVEAAPQLELFSENAKRDAEKDEKLDRALDAIKDKLGDHAIKRASGME